MADEKAAEAKEEAPSGPKMVMGMPMPTFLFVVVNVLVMIGAFVFILRASLFYKKPAITDAQATAEITKAEQKKAVEIGDEVLTISYPEMTITLRSEQGGKTHYATVEASVVCGSDACESQVRENKAKVQDAIQTVLSARSYTELSSLDTKFRVKHEILHRVNSFLEDTAAVDVLFTSFLVQ
jgi:flagellar FliL protein